MEGRARARPNLRADGVGILPSSVRARAAKLEAGDTVTFNGGPGTCPAKPAHPWVPAQAACPAESPPFNGGPGTCPAKRRLRSRPLQCGMPAVRIPPFNGGPGTCPAKPTSPRRMPMAGELRCLQWRAGHVPGQTRVADGSRRLREPPSMEGRARARPNGGASPEHRAARWRASLQWRAGHVPGQTAVASTVTSRRAIMVPSMEGRARARPNHRRSPPFNGGPAAPHYFPRRLRLQWRAGHVPGQTQPVAYVDVHPVPGCPPNLSAGDGVRAPLQWRAGHVPGQTSGDAILERHEPRRPPSMEGRARARPNRSRTEVRRSSATDPSFNGGPGTCPAKPPRSDG